MTNLNDAVETVSKRRLQMTVTEVMFIDVSVDEAERLLDPNADSLDVYEAAARFRRISAFDIDQVDSGVELQAREDGDGSWGLRPVDGEARERYLWSARHFIGKARQELSSGRYREGRCPELDQVNGALARLEDELRLMALEIDHPDMPEVQAWRTAHSEEGALS